jgi:hypothetical protein
MSLLCQFLINQLQIDNPTPNHNGQEVFMKKAILIIVPLLMIACAGVRIERVTDANRNVEGLRYYRPCPYLLVTEGTQGTLRSELIMLPNLNEEYVVRSHAGIGKVDLKIKLEQGWNLVELGEISDTRIAENIESLSDLLDSIARAQLSETGPFKPGLYAFIFDNGMVSGIRKIF